MLKFRNMRLFYHITLEGINAKDLQYTKRHLRNTQPSFLKNPVHFMHDLWMREKQDQRRASNFFVQDALSAVEHKDEAVERNGRDARCPSCGRDARHPDMPLGNKRRIGGVLGELD